MNRYFASLIAGVAAMAALTGCSEKKWHAEGTVEGAESASLIVEAPNGRGGWYALDTVTTDKKGHFKVAGAPAGHPEVFRLTLDGKSIYFPIDSLESVDIRANAATFATDYTVSGSESADKLQHINDLINKTIKEKGAEAAAFDPDLKRQLAEAVLRDPAGAVAYYTIFRKVADLPLFDPTQKSDLRIVGAVANAFNTQRPADPRTKFLETYYLSGRRNIGASVPTDTLVAMEIKLPEISLLDNKGKRRSISDVASEGKVVVLNFTTYAAEASPAFNVELAKVYNAHHSEGLEVYQIAFDDDEFQWRQAAANLPWSTVYNAPADGDQVLRDYNVGSLPATFVINRQGELVERVPDISHLAATVARYL